MRVLAAAYLVALGIGAAPHAAMASTATATGTVVAATVGGTCGTPAVPTTTIFLPNITKTLGGPSGWVTPFIVQNVGVKAATLEVSFFQFSDGALVTCRKVTGLAPGTSFADYPNNDADLPSDSQFAVVVRSFGSEVVSVVNEHQGIGVPDRQEALSYDGLTRGGTTIYVPFVGKPDAGPCSAVPPAEANCDQRWLTTLVIQNLGALEATVSARFTSYDGASTATLTRTIGPGRSRFIDASVEPQVRAGRYYSVVLTATQPIGVIANNHDDAAGSPAPRGFSYNGIAQPVTGDVFLPYVRRDSGVREYAGGVLVQNAGVTDAVPTLSFQPLGGGAPLTLSAPSPLKPGASWYFDPSSSALAPGEHSLVVSGGTLAVIGVVLAPGTAMGYVGADARGNRAYLPNVTRTLGGPSGWTTPILLQSSGATTAKLRWYRFADGALVARQSVGPFARGAAIRVDPRSVPGLADDTQYGVVVDGQGGTLTAIVTELSFQGGDGAMAYEGFAATVDPVPAPTALSIAPATLRLGTLETAQLTVVVKDQFDEEMPQQTPAWTVTPIGLGAVSASGVFTAGSSAAVGAVTATAGIATESVAVTVQAPTPVTVGGISFLVRTSGSADVYTETGISSAEAAGISSEVNADVTRIELDYVRAFVGRPQVYVEATSASYRSAQTAILGLAQVFSSGSVESRFESAGVYYLGKVAIDWSLIKDQHPFTTGRHELTHMMIDEISGDATVPAWLNEGSARLEEFTVSGSEWLQTLDTYRAESLAATNQIFSIDQLTSQSVWNTRAFPAVTYQYSEAQAVVQLLRNEIGIRGEVGILESLAAGQTYDEAYAAASGRTTTTFASSIPLRLRALGTPPGIAFAPDSFAGGNATGPTFVFYGWSPNASLDVSIVGLSSGFVNNTRSAVADQYGVYQSRLSTSWPPDTYRFTVTAGSTSVTATFTKGG
jgi:hypothetical protein